MFKKLTVVLLVLLLIGMFSEGVFAATKILDIYGPWTGPELEAFKKMVKPFEDANNIEVGYTGYRDPVVLITRVEAGNPPDVAGIPMPGLAMEFAKANKLVDLSSFMDMNMLRSNYSPTWLDLGAYKGKLYGVFIAADIKSLVWYSPKAFAAAGYALPTTWDEMIALSDKMVADGKTPWAIGLECGAASGWPGTDWIEDIMLRTVGPDVYDLWVAHEISWLDERVQRAFELFGQFALNEKYVYGGTKTELITSYTDAADPLFTTPPNAYMHRQATFIKSFILDHFPNLVPGEDFNFFPLPPIDPQYGTPILGASDMVVMFNDTPEVRAFMEYITSPEAHEIWVAEVAGSCSANRRVNPAVYPDDLTRKAAKILNEASTFRFDGSDLMPSAVGAGSFWTGILDYVSGVPLIKVLMTIETSALDAYRK
jgi:alpha-glucoside transport system substrate-binding protein